MCALLLAIAARAGAAQSEPCVGGVLAKYPEPAAPLQDDRPMDGVTRYDLTIQQPHDTAPRALGTMTVAQTMSRCVGNDIVRRVIVYDYGAAGRVVDTTLSIALTLAPISERTHKTSGDIVLDFEGGVVRGRMTRAGKTRAIHDSLATPAFNSTDLELVVRSLALRRGMSTAVQIYDPEYGGLRPDSISVLDLEPARVTGAEASWVVRSRDRRLESTYRITEHSRQLLSADIRADSTRYRLANPARLPPR
ncbi:MAG: hypothetical protein ACREMU_11440 [Gemmatimonadaceae bacterium]